jgi:hypothetical protein
MSIEGQVMFVFYVKKLKMEMPRQNQKSWAPEKYEQYNPKYLKLFFKVNTKGRNKNKYIGPPSFLDWKKARVGMKFLK